ncbi:hypothetical protein QET40_06830 [Akkermansia sp. N21169]|uniref:hypothetical protein n=1 Tax=Akkermansia sp. N21169 TaxID=3040765 RepID=UPI00244EE308|nr:hypothetical protein [Akkermansia sp. N21169]MDH3068829.1 hypothetical protein [Akkermansia sp. N21169]
MCEPFKTWGSELIKRYGIAVVGFIFAAWVYSDFKNLIGEFSEFQRRQVEVQAQQTEILRTMDLRIQKLETIR